MPASIPASTLEKFTTFGDFLRFLRRRAGITQLELSIAVGYSDAQISRLEQNLRLPDIPTIEARFVPALGLEDDPKAIARLVELAANVRREDAPGLGLCPYKGLNYFDEADADLFAGREAMTARLVDQVLSLVSNRRTGQVRLLAIVGASGSGKSSLVRAGLLPALRWNPDSANWLIHVLTPTTHPLESLATSLTGDTDSVAAAAALMDDLAREPRSLYLFARRLLKSSGALHLLLVVDQFEELFALCRSEEDRAAFIENLMAAASDPGGLCIAILTLRADFYAPCAAYPALREALAHQQEYIGAMSNAELRRAIEEPARRGRWEFEPGLVDLLLHDVGADALHPPEPGALPLLSHALLETWQRRRGRTMTLGGYASSGGVRSAIAETAEAVFVDHFSRKQQAIARRIFLRLSELGDEETGTGDTRRRATFDELILNPEAAAVTQDVLKALADARLITTGENSAEVAHEALIREWPTLRGWLEENRDGLRMHRQLTDAAQEWRLSGGEADLLYRGARLAQAREWATQHAEEMNAQEQEFLAASIDWSEREAAEREAQHQRELEAAQKLAEAEAQRAELESQRADEQAYTATQLRQRAIYLAGAFVIALAMAFTALYFGSRARQAAITANSQQRVAFSRELAAASIASLDEDPERGILLALQAVSVTYSADNTWTAEAEDALRRALQASRLELTLRGHTDFVSGAAFRPDGKGLVTISDDGTLKLWDEATGEALLTVPTGATRGRHGAAFSPDGSHLAAASQVGTAKIWDAATGQELLTLSGHTNWVFGVAFSPDGKRLATASEDRTAKIWDAATGQELLTLRGHPDWVLGVAFSPDGESLATAGKDGKVKVWDVATGQELLTCSTGSLPANRVAFSPDGKRLAAASDAQAALVWNAETCEEMLVLRGHTGAVNAVAFSPDGSRMATAGDDGKVKVWDARTGQELFTLSGHNGPVEDVSFSPDCDREPHHLVIPCGARLVTASQDGTARVWNASFNRELLTLSMPGVSSGAISLSGRLIASGYPDGAMKVWDISPALQAALNGASTSLPEVKEQLAIPGPSSEVSGMAFSADGKRLAAGREDGTSGILDLATGQELQTLSGHAGNVYPLVFSPDGTRLATSSVDYTVKVWDLAKDGGKLLFSQYTPEWSFAIAFSPDGARLAMGSNDGTARVRDDATGQELLTLRGHAGEIWGVAFSPDGTLLATASNDRTAKVWDAATGQELLTLSGHSGEVNGVAYSPDGSRLATAGQDGLAKLWDAATGQELLTLLGQSGALAGVGFSQDGRQLITSTFDGLVRFYLLRIEDLTALARQRVTRSLTAAECLQYLHLPQEQCSQEEPSLVQAAPPAEVVPAGEAQAPSPKGKVCELTSNGMDDQIYNLYNQMAYEGVRQASEKFAWDVFILDSLPPDYPKRINELVQSNCSLIVAPTALFYSDIIEETAKAHSDQKFLAIGPGVYDTILENVRVEIYAVDEGGFLAGYVAASVTKTGKVGTFGGINFPPVTYFMDGFALGVAHYNEKNGTNVQVLGWNIEKHDGLFTGNFEDSNEGRRMAEQLMDQGADVILPVAGSLGLGAAAVIKERGGAYIIGVDTDWTEAYPEYAGIVLTSIEKRMDASVVTAVQAIIDGTFTGGDHWGNLENGGVGIAPFHKLDALVSPQVKAELEQIEAAIVAGKIQTHPPEETNP